MFEYGERMKKSELTQLQSSVTAVARVHFFFVALFVAIIVLSDAWNLIPPSVVLQRWTLASLLLALTAVIWYIARSTQSQALQKAFLWLFIIVDIAVATILVFSQRGMASKSVILYALPLIVAAQLRTRAALLATAALSLAAYSLAVMRYFVTSPGEGYKAELYVEIIFFGGLFFVIAGLLWALVRRQK